MLTETRWQKEQELMQSVFPEFRPFTRESRFGFEGHLKAPRSSQIYGVTLEADHRTYPQSPPTVSMQPRIGIHWIGDGERRRLCMEREWRPARSTFANTLLALVRYLDENDPPPRSASQQPPGEGTPRAGDDSETSPNVGRSFWATV
jgi:ubiquitin-protein ligase